MRIFDQIRQPGAVLNMAGSDLVRHPLGPVADSLREGVAGTTRVIADDCASWFWKADRDDWNLSEHFGPLRLPYPQMWIEWRMPRKILVLGEWTDSRGTDAFAVLIHENSPTNEAPEGTYKTLNVAWITQGSGLLVIFPLTHLIHVNESGSVLGQDVTHSKDFDSSQAFELAANFCPAFLAIGLMNCKNVQVREEGPPPKLARATRKRHGVTPLRYHVISLPSRPSVRSNAEAKQAAGAAMPLHLVRGHFKTYTADAPLLGSHTGTYWWGWQSRGNKSAGEVRKHYTVGPRDGAT